MQFSRILKISEYLKEKHTASVSELSELMGVSMVTIRKDLNMMEKDGYVIKTHGGVVLASISDEVIKTPGFSSEVDATTEIAKNYVQPGDFIFLGSGRTCLSLAEKIKDIENISVITNNVSAINILCPKIRNLVLIGGEIVVGLGGHVHTINSDIRSVLGGIYFNKAFTSGVGIDANAGLTVNTMGSTYVDKMIPDLCDSWYVMMDSSKFGIKAFYQAARLEQISFLVTNQTDPHILSSFQEKGISVISPNAREKT